MSSNSSRSDFVWCQSTVRRVLLEASRYTPFPFNAAILKPYAVRRLASMGMPTTLASTVVSPAAYISLRMNPLPRRLPRRFSFFTVTYRRLPRG